MSLSFVSIPLPEENNCADNVTYRGGMIHAACHPVNSRTAGEEFGSLSSTITRSELVSRTHSI
jgi:hypothetical protein